MRIISGIYGGRRITPPGNLPVRPTTDLAREALFNLLQTRIDLEDAAVIDLFSGTGFVTYEFISRGAATVTSVDISSKCTAFIRSTADILGIQSIDIIRGDVFRFLNSTMRRADLIFADPPYELETIPLLPDLVFEKNILLPDGLFILEHGKKHSFVSHPNFREEKQYGKVHFTFFQNLPANQPDPEAP